MAYGFEIRDNSGNVVVDDGDSQLYVISRHYVPFKSTSYIYEPNFDSNDGEWIIKNHFTPIYPTGSVSGIPTGYQAYDSYVDESNPAVTNLGGVAGTNSNLEFTWDNSSKIFSWYAPVMYFGDTWAGFDLVNGFGYFWAQGNFEVTFTRYI